MRFDYKIFRIIEGGSSSAWRRTRNDIRVIIMRGEEAAIRYAARKVNDNFAGSPLLPSLPPLQLSSRVTRMRGEGSDSPSREITHSVLTELAGFITDAWYALKLIVMKVISMVTRAARSNNGIPILVL